ncbi:hypothetical protein AB0M36_03955 [Actinoplanes sp. NPDC051346]|uniref:hypothetical protein n=1 Tax=Actinoplanes sp. NPDC051346 TaxID=3155048 RepID=UPI00343EEEFD
MRSADLRNVIVVRQRELASRHEVLGREGRDPGRYEDLLLRVFDATNDLVRDLDRLRARSARRRWLTAVGLAVVALVLAALVAAAVLPIYGLIGAAVALVAATTLAVVARATAPPAEASTGSGDPRAASRGKPAAPDAEPAPMVEDEGEPGVQHGPGGLPRPRRQAVAEPALRRRSERDAIGTRKAGA